MVSEKNVKIVINEYDNTKPGGAGTAPSDVVFVPGFSNKSDAPKNTPVMCTDVYEFEKLFGTEPKKLTADDVKGYEDYGFVPRQFDASYIYAKELLYLGMPVVYSNIVSNTASCLDVFYSVSDGYSNVSLQELYESGKLYIKDENGDSVDAADVTIDGNTVTTTVDRPTLYIDYSGYVKFKVNYGCNDAETVKIDGTYVPKLDDDETIYEGHVNNQIEIYGTVSYWEFEYFKKKSEGSKNDVEDIVYDNNNIFDQLNLISDKSLYSVKYITSGGYPSVVSIDNKVKSVFATDMLTAAATRGDAVALIDYQMCESEKAFDISENGNSFYKKMHTLFNNVSNAEFGAMMYPWGQFTCAASLSNVAELETNDVYMPGSFSYMKCLAKAIKTSPNWLAMAGVSRGVVPGLNMIMTPRNQLSNTDAEEMQPKFGVDNHKISINCVTNIRPYGLTLWGNRTLKPVSRDGCVALNFLNTRNMLSDIKKVLYSTAKSLMFEQNSDTLWLRFKAGITPLLNQLKTGQGISDYKIVRGTTKYNGDPLQKGEVAAVIKIYPLYAVEYFELAVEINDEDVTVL